jgi:hypothetical protein
MARNNLYKIYVGHKKCPICCGGLGDPPSVAHYSMTPPPKNYNRK